METKSKAIQYGIIGAFIWIIFGIISYVLGTSLFDNMGLAIGFGLLSLVIIFILPIIFMVLSALSFRKGNGGFIDLQKAFREAFIPIVIMIVLGLVFNILMYNVIDTEYPKQVMEKSIEMSETQFERAGWDEERIDKRIAKMKKNDRFAIGNVFKQNAIFLAAFGAIAMLIAAIVKKKNPDLIS